MQEPGSAQRKIVIPYFDGVNSLVSFNMAKKTEFVHAENARSKIIGTIEKREGQTVLGTNSVGKPFVTTNNYGLFSFQNSNNQGLYRISVNENALLSINTFDDIFIAETYNDPTKITISVKDVLNIKEQVNNGTGDLVTFYYLNGNNNWIPLTGDGTGIPGGVFDYTYAEGCVFLVNLNSDNRYIDTDGITVKTSKTPGGHLYNTPPASKINFYKNRLYIADYIYGGVRYKNSILRSSYPTGIVALVNADYNSTLSTTIAVTDNKYFYTDSGQNSYDIYRGNTKITTVTVNTINETNIIVAGTISSILASDEIWVAGTYTGKKIFQWINNPSSSGRDVKQYDTMKLSGGENDSITVLTNIGNIMFASNKNAMISWNDYTMENFDLDIGCVSPSGYIKMIGTLYFLHYTGIYSTTGGVPKLLSNKIEKYITGATKFGKENSTAGKKGRNIFFTLGDVTLYKPDGSVDKILKDVCAEFNIIQENWYIHTNVKASEFATFVEATDSDRLVFTDTSGNQSSYDISATNLEYDASGILKSSTYTIDCSTNSIQLMLSDFGNNLPPYVVYICDVCAKAKLSTP